MNKKGSALLWALVVIGVLSILIAASLTISFSYKNRAVVNNYKRQAYLTSKGFIEDIVNNIKDGNEEYLALFQDTSKEKFTPLVEVGQQIPLTISLPMSNEMGAVTNAFISINALREEENELKALGSITIHVEAMYGNETHGINADLLLGRKNEEGLKWQLIKYYQIDDAISVGNNITVASNLLNECISLYNVYMEKGYSAVLEIMKNDPGWENIPVDVQKDLERFIYFDDTTIRKYFCYRNETQMYVPFDKTEIKKEKLKVPIAQSTIENGIIITKALVKDIDLQDVISKVDFDVVNFYENEFYIQPKYFNGNKTMQFIYANRSGSFSNGGAINLIYCEGSWYFIGKVSLGENSEATLLGPTTFDNASAKEWDYFKKHYLTEGNKIQ